MTAADDFNVPAGGTETVIELLMCEFFISTLLFLQRHSFQSHEILVLHPLTTVYSYASFHVHTTWVWEC